MTTETQTLWGHIVERAKFAWREQNQKPDPITEKFYRREKIGRSVTNTMIEIVFMTIVVASIAYLTADIFLRFGSPETWLIYRIAWLYSLQCQGGGNCSLPYLNAGLVVGVDLVVLITIYLWSAIDSISQTDDWSELHDHLDLISRQIRVDYDGLGKLEERMNAVEVAIEDADNRVDMVVEYQPRDEGRLADQTSEVTDDAEPIDPAA